MKMEWHDNGRSPENPHNGPVTMHADEENEQDHLIAATQISLSFFIIYHFFF